MTQKILVTGASGFVGKHLTEYLKGYGFSDCVILSRESLNSVTLNDLQNIDVVIHLAGKAHDLKKVSDPDAYYEVNYQLTCKLYDVFLKSEATKFIFLSSVKAAADQVVGVLKEDAQPRPETDYGKSKLLAEEFIISAPRDIKKRYFILRPCMIHGPNNKGNLNLLYHFVKQGIPYPLAGFVNQRSFLSISNLCFIITELILSHEKILSGVYQVADDEPLSTNDIVNILSTSIGKKSKLWSISPSIIRFMARVGDVLNLPLTTERLIKLTESYTVSNKKIVDAINKPLPLSAKEGLELTAKSFKE